MHTGGRNQGKINLDEKYPHYQNIPNLSQYKWSRLGTAVTKKYCAFLRNLSFRSRLVGGALAYTVGLFVYGAIDLTEHQVLAWLVNIWDGGKSLSP